MQCSGIFEPITLTLFWTSFCDHNIIIGYACCHPKITLKEEKGIEAEVPVHCHSSFFLAHEFLLDFQVNLIEAAVSPVEKN